MTTNKRYINYGESVIDTVTDELVNAYDENSAGVFVLWLNEKEDSIQKVEEANMNWANDLGKVIDENEQLKSSNMEYEDMLGNLEEENEKLKQINKGQELEIVRLHKLADAMSSVLRELGIHDVYNRNQIENVKLQINYNRTVGKKKFKELWL